MITLKNSMLNSTFVLDISHIYVSAYDSGGNLLWKTDPYIDNHIDEYRTRRPIIVDILFCDNPFAAQKKREITIGIVYSNTQFGYLNLKTGKYIFGGQD